MSKLSKLRKKHLSQLANKTNASEEKIPSESTKSLGRQRAGVIRRPRAKVAPPVVEPEKPATLIRKKTDEEASDQVKTVEVVETSTQENVVETQAKAEEVVVESKDKSETVVVETKEKEEVVVEEVVQAKAVEPLPPKKEEPKKDPRLAGLGKAVIAPPAHYRLRQEALAKEKAGPSGKELADQAKAGKVWTDPNAPKSDKTKPTNTKSTKNKSKRSKQKNWGNALESKEDPRSSRRRRRPRRSKLKPIASPKAKAIKRRVMVNETITVANLAHGMSIKVGMVIKKLIEMGQMASINDALDLDIATLVAEEFDFEVVDTSFQEDEFLITEEEGEKEEGEVRPPIVTIMGHVDHGKTTLLDTIRKANVAESEAGGITQHTSAYQVEHDGKLITFIDTPGHEAFTSMRARGAQVTDIVILVVAADDGPMPQTIEALNHAKASGVQIMVAINKCDKPGANPDKVRQDMMRYELVDEAYGGDTMFIEVSALKGDGIPELLENIVLLSEMGEFNANYDRHADGFVLEARLEKGRGAVATLLVKNGTLNTGDTLVLGNVWGRVRAMNNYKGTKIDVALPSSPVELIGLQDIPLAGDDFVVVKSIKEAKALVLHRKQQENLTKATTRKVSLEDIVKMQEEGETVKLNLIVKSDVGGTLEALRASIGKIDVPRTEVNIMHEAIGGITESDVSLAHTYGGIIIGFNVRPEAKARALINQLGVEVRSYNIIYEALEDIEKGLKGLLAPEVKEQWKGSAEIRETFTIPKIGTIAGCFVLDGTIARSHQVRLLRAGTIVWEGKLASLKRFKDDVREVEKGYECGMNLEAFNDIKIGDQLETFVMEEVVVE